MGIIISYERLSGDGDYKNDEKIICKSNSVPNFDWFDGDKFPTKIEEGYRLHARHFALKHVCHGNFTAPLKETIIKGSKILFSHKDVGCGSGQWSIEIAQMFPDAEVYGIDISPNLPFIAPYNCTFVHGNILSGFENISKTYWSIPLGRWGGRIGEINAANLKQAYLTIQPWLAPFTELTEDEYNRTIKQIVDKELDEYHSYTNHHIILVKKSISGHWFS
ncbi:19595_t:CDS:2 [Dentiscutata erythropus]|uniref:19595_t:CDS:1 n=1 Tax=Dentiscutata erythropus TaxID=1348616 RepID=A0A9N9DJJ3_9GLOM|nr:19595_t:CDS:2 [Dentiscutata erythropus]